MSSLLDLKVGDRADITLQDVSVTYVTTRYVQVKTKTAGSEFMLYFENRHEMEVNKLEEPLERDVYYLDADGDLFVCEDPMAERPLRCVSKSNDTTTIVGSAFKRTYMQDPVRKFREV